MLRLEDNWTTHNYHNGPLVITQPEDPRLKQVYNKVLVPSFKEIGDLEDLDHIQECLGDTSLEHRAMVFSYFAKGEPLSATVSFFHIYDNMCFMDGAYTASLPQGRPHNSLKHMMSFRKGVIETLAQISGFEHPTTYVCQSLDPDKMTEEEKASHTIPPEKVIKKWLNFGYSKANFPYKVPKQEGGSEDRYALLLFPQDPRYKGAEYVDENIMEGILHGSFYFFDTPFGQPEQFAEYNEMLAYLKEHPITELQK